MVNVILKKNDNKRVVMNVYL